MSQIRIFLKVDNLQLNLEISPTTCKPGETVQLSVQSTIQSTVSLLAIDQRVLLLKSGNDLSLNEIYENLDQYNSAFGGGIVFDDVPFLKRRPFFPWIWYETYEMKFEVRKFWIKFVVGAKEVLERLFCVFQRANFLIISNAVDSIPSNKCKNFFLTDC